MLVTEDVFQKGEYDSSRCQQDGDLGLNATVINYNLCRDLYRNHSANPFPEPANSTLSATSQQSHNDGSALYLGLLQLVHFQGCP